MSFVSVATQMAIQAAIQAAQGKSKDEIGRSAAKSAISGVIGGAVGGGLGGGTLGEGIGGSIGGAAANAAFGESPLEGALYGGAAGAMRGYARSPADVKGMPSSFDEFGTNFKGSLPANPFSEAGRADIAKANAGYTDRFDITNPKTYMPTTSQGGVDRVNTGIDRTVAATKGLDTADPLGASQIESRAAETELAAARGIPITQTPSILTPTPTAQTTGDFIKDNYGKLATAGLVGAGGAYLLGSNGNSSAPTVQTQLQPALYNPTEPDKKAITKTYVPRYAYAKGGIIGPDGTVQNTPEEVKLLNPFVQMGVDQVKQQGVPQQLPLQQGVPQQRPLQQGVPQQAPQGYANGGSLNEQSNGSDAFMDQVRAQMSMGLQGPSVQPVPSVLQQPPVPVAPAMQQAPQAAANGGIMRDNLGEYSHGGIAGLTRGPGDGVSDSIPAEIGNSGKQPARLADGEFVISSRIVSELGNGSTEAGAKALQAMVDRVQSKRQKSIGKGKVAVDSKARKELLG